MVIRRLLRAPLSWLVIVLLGLGAAGGLWWFQPWRLVTDTEVREPLTVAGPARPPATSLAASPAAPPSAAAPAAPADGPAVVLAGDFVTHEHDTSGTARLVRDADGGHRLEIAGLDTSDGPDLRVWLTDQPVRPGRAGWQVFDDGRWVELGRLKGNRGDQVYRVPAGVDVDGLRSVSIWCKRFAVSFGAAPLAAA